MAVHHFNNGAASATNSSNFNAFGVIATIMASLFVVLIPTLLFRLYATFFKSCRFVSRAPHLKRHPLNVVVVLGSGGHTSEMIQSLQLLGTKWTEHRCVYIVSENDKDSAEAAKVFEQSLRRYASVKLIPRARNVGQSYPSSVKTTLIALYKCFSLMWEEAPDVILTNGPGVCIPVVLSSLFISAFCSVSLFSFWGGPHSKHLRPMIAYFESFTCVDHLSVSGKLLRPISDIFTVQWPQLLEKLEGSKIGGSGTLLTGPFAGPSHNNKSNEDEQHLHFIRPVNRVALVTVGSTKFDDLVGQVKSTNFLASLKAAKVSKLYVQKGRSDAMLLCEDGSVKGAGGTVASTEANFVSRAQADFGIEVDIFDYRPNLAATFFRRTKASSQISPSSSPIRGATTATEASGPITATAVDILISHAGAGTILEAFSHKIPTIVVPNTKLMNNHQLLFAESLAKRAYLVSCEPNGLTDGIKKVAFACEGENNSQPLFVFPFPNADIIKDLFGVLVGAGTSSKR